MFNDSTLQAESNDFDLNDYSPKKDDSRNLDHTSQCIEETLRLSMPSWPLQNSVAVNPFWNYKNKPFKELVNTLEDPLACKMLPSLTEYLQKYRKGVISKKALSSVLAPHIEDLGSENLFISQAENLSLLEDTRPLRNSC